MDKKLMKFDFIIIIIIIYSGFMSPSFIFK